jgi:hypothetical protein
MARQHHTIEIFSANCSLCIHTDDIRIGKCDGCYQVVYDVNEMTEEIKQKMKTYGVNSVPTTVIDGEVKVSVSHLSLSVGSNCIVGAKMLIIEAAGGTQTCYLVSI